MKRMSALIALSLCAGCAHDTLRDMDFGPSPADADHDKAVLEQARAIERLIRGTVSTCEAFRAVRQARPSAGGTSTPDLDLFPLP